jgi:GDSL-like lipase/acylhydrolase family protein
MNMIKLILPITLITSFTLLVGAQTTNVPPSARESIEWCDIWISHANETNLPRVLLIGDSITRAYYPEVEKLLAGRAYVARLATSRFISDPVLLQEIALVLDNTKFDVIHFNNGMHGWQHSEMEYGDAFPKFLATIKAHAPNAKLIWASTTTLKVSKHLPPDDQTQASDERIAARNTIALQYIQPQGIEVDDLNSLVRGHPEYHSDNVHFNDQGIALQATQVAARIEPLLKN